MTDCMIYECSYLSVCHIAESPECLAFHGASKESRGTWVLPGHSLPYGYVYTSYRTPVISQGAQDFNLCTECVYFHEVYRSESAFHLGASTESRVKNKVTSLTNLQSTLTVICATLSYVMITQQVIQQ